MRSCKWENKLKQINVGKHTFHFRHQNTYYYEILAVARGPDHYKLKMMSWKHNTEIKTILCVPSFVSI